MEWLSKANVYIYCCIAAVLSLTSYLAAFSIEISWLLEAKGDLPTPSYLLCAEYFVLFIASTILIHGLATQMAWGLLSWSAIIALTALPELYLVIYMITQHWGFESVHGLTELIGYLIRLVINCLALACVIPTALQWRQEKKVQKQLESLANRLQLTTPLPDTQFGPPALVVDKNGSIRSTSSRRSHVGSILNGYTNAGFESHENGCAPLGSSENEFNASIFGLSPSMYIGPPIPEQPISKRTQSLLDLRFLFPSKTNKYSTKDETDSKCLNNDQNHNAIPSKIFSNNISNQPKTKLSNVACTDDTYSQSIFSKDPKGLRRNCVSLDNLNAINSLYRNDLNLYGNNLLQNYALQFQPYGYVPYPFYYCYPPYQMQRGFYGPYLGANGNSRQSIGTSSTDDFRKYRDVAL